MRLSSRKRSEERMELSTTGMIDIVFLLLVFFLATASFLPPEKEIRPAISTEEKSSSASNDLEKAIVEIVAEGAGFVYKLGSETTNDRNFLIDQLNSFPNKVDGAFVRTDDEAPFDMTAQAISACKKAGFIVVTFLSDAD